MYEFVDSIVQKIRIQAKEIVASVSEQIGMCEFVVYYGKKYTDSYKWNCNLQTERIIVCTNSLSLSYKRYEFRQNK